MQPDIFVEIHQGSFFRTGLFICWLAGILLMLFIMIYAAPLCAVPVTLAALLPACVFIYVCETTPTVIRADGGTLCWRHLNKTYRLALSDIEQLTCAPYTEHTRYGTYAHVRLTLHMKDGTEHIFDDRTEACAAPEIQPLQRLYEYLQAYPEKGDTAS